MHHNNIRLIVRKQLKKQLPNWNRLPKKQKKDITKKVMDEAVAEYDFSQVIKPSKEELLGVNEQLPANIIPLHEMAQHIEMATNNKILKFNNYKRSSIYIKDEELAFIDGLIIDSFINRLISNDTYTPSARSLFPANLFRAELLKTIKYPEISYRKFCTEEYLGLDRKQNRVFMGLPLNKKVMIDHSQLSKFRSNLSFAQQVNLLVYILHHFNKSGLLGDNVIHAVDSTELANDCRLPLAVITVKGKKIRIYNDLDSDCGKRRNKRNKSSYVIGYRLHTLTAINAQTGQSYPIVSLLAPANHHDSHFLSFLVDLSQAMGVDVKLVTADEAYHDKDGTLYKKSGVIVTTPPSGNVTVPKNVNSNTGAVFCHDECSIPMKHAGYENQEHEYTCGASIGECQHAQSCNKSRFIPMDRGLFQRIPFATGQIKQAHDIRKNCERTFNLLKNQTGLEILRVRSQQATMARCTISSIAVIFIKMAGLRKKKQPEKIQQQDILALAA